MSRITCTVNGEDTDFLANPGTSLLDALRELGLTGAKEGCGTGDCGACSVLMDGKVTCACPVFAPPRAACSGRGLSSADGVDGDHLHPLQQTFLEGAALQCGVCTPGFLVAAKALLDHNPDPTESEIRYALRAISAAAPLRQDHPLRSGSGRTAQECDTTAIENPKTYKWVGTRPIRHDGYDKVCARFAADLNLPGQLHAAYLRSPHAHANIVSIDTSKRESMPGVKAVITGDDFPALDITDPNHDVSINVLARGTVLYHGHAIAAVAATTKAEAQAAAARSRSSTSFCRSCSASTSHGRRRHSPTSRTTEFVGPSDPSNIATHTPLERGDAEAAMAAADIVIEREFDCATSTRATSSPACVVDTGADGKANVWASSQGHFMVRAITVAVLGWETSRIKVTPAEIGGGFGGKTTVPRTGCRPPEREGRPSGQAGDEPRGCFAVGPGARRQAPHHDRRHQRR